MRYSKLLGIGLLSVSLLLPAPVRAGSEGRRNTAIAAAVAIGALALSRNRHRNRYYAPSAYYGSPYSSSGVYGAPVYGAPVYGAPVYGAVGGPMVPGAASFIDEGDFRNYRDAYGNYLGRVPLASIPPGRW